MGAVLDAIIRRRSVRKYTGEDLTTGQLETILQAGLLAPTSQDRRPCRFVVVRDRNLLRRLSRAKGAGAGMLDGAAAGIVVQVDGNAIDTWVEDGSIALAFMHLAAADLGLGSCWVQMHLRKASDGTDAEEVVRRVLGLGDEQRIVGILSLGVPAQEQLPRSTADADFGKVTWL